MEIIYKINEKDTLYDIAIAFNTTVEDIKKINGIEKIFKGQRLLISAKEGIKYRVEPKNTLKLIADKFNTSVEKLMNDNNITNERDIFIGQMLLILK